MLWACTDQCDWWTSGSTTELAVALAISPRCPISARPCCGPMTLSAPICCVHIAKTPDPTHIARPPTVTSPSGIGTYAG